MNNNKTSKYSCWQWVNILCLPTGEESPTVTTLSVAIMQSVNQYAIVLVIHWIFCGVLNFTNFVFQTTKNQIIYNGPQLIFNRFAKFQPLKNIYIYGSSFHTCWTDKLILIFTAKYFGTYKPWPEPWHESWTYCSVIFLEYALCLSFSNDQTKSVQYNGTSGRDTWSLGGSSLLPGPPEGLAMIKKLTTPTKATPTKHDVSSKSTWARKSRIWLQYWRREG